MTPTDLRDTLTTVADALAVPPPDLASFEHRVSRTRRRRTAVRVAGAAAAVLVVAGGSSLALGSGSEPRGVAPTRPAPEITAVPLADTVPVLVRGHLRLVQDGELGPEGPAAAEVVGSTPEGVVVLTEEGVLERVAGDGSVERLVPEDVRFAYLDGDAVVYTDTAGLTHWWGISPTVERSDSAQDEGRVFAAGSDSYVAANLGGSGLALHTPDGVVPLPLPADGTAAHGVGLGGDVVAVRLDAVHFFDLTGRPLATAGDGALLGALAPDGHAYAQLVPGPGRVELVDPTTGEDREVEGPSRNIDGRIDDLGWAPDGDLLVVVTYDTTSALWRCGPDGDGCAIELRDRTGTLRLG